MPTFKLEEMDDDLSYGGDNDMYFRQWRLPSMKPVLDEKLDRDFQDAVSKKEKMKREKTERRQKHSEKYDKKFQDLVKQMKEATLKKEEARKENVPFLRKPTDLELETARHNLEKEFASPSSTARMVPFNGRLRPRQNPIFGEKMTGLKSLVLPPSTSSNPSVSTPKDPSFSGHETVFYPQAHDSFNLDHYNGSRPSFAFAGNGATSTPVSKSVNFLSGGILEEEGDDSVFEQSKYVTAMESPIQPPKTGEKEQILREEQAKRASEQATAKATLEREKREDEEETQRRLERAKKLEEKEKMLPEKMTASNQQNQNPNRFGRGLTEKSSESVSLIGQKAVFNEQSTKQKSTDFSSLSGVKSAQAESKPPLNTGIPSIFSQKKEEKPTGATLLFGSKPAQNPIQSDFSSSIFGSKPTQSLATTETKSPINTGFSSLFGSKPAQSLATTETKSPINTGFSSLFGQKPSGSEQKLNEKPSLFGAKKTETETKSPGFSSLFGAKPSVSKPKSEETPVAASSLFGAKPAGAESKSPLSTGTSTLLGQKSTDNEPKSEATSPKFGFAIPSPSSSSAAPAPSKSMETPEATPPPEPIQKEKGPSPPYVLFRNYIGLMKTLLDEKQTYEKSSDPHFRALLKRTITEKVTVFTQRQTDSDARNEILEFFKSLLQKKSVLGFAVIGEAPTLQLVTDEDVNYSIYCIVDKYISLAELDEDLAPTISDLISRLALTIRRVEKVFIVIMFNKSTLLRQNPDECLEKFVQVSGTENDEDKAHRKTMEWSQEQALVILFFMVFTKDAFFCSKGRKLVLSDELLWKYVETSIAHVLFVPKAPFIILQLITICKPRLHADPNRWEDMLATIESEILPELEQESFKGDEGIVGRLGHVLGVLQA